MCGTRRPDSAGFCPACGFDFKLLEGVRADVTPATTPPLPSGGTTRPRPASISGLKPAPPSVVRSPRYRVGQIVGTTLLVVLVAVIGYVTFSTAARLGEPGPSTADDASPSAHAVTACEQAVADVIDHPERAVVACASQDEVDAAYRTVFLEPPQWGSEFRDACAADPALRSRPLCTATPRPTRASDAPTPSSAPGRSGSPTPSS